jgi:hypothetical protein
MLPSIIIFAQANTPLWKQILADIPHDGPAFVGYALVVAFGAMIWLGSRKRPE